MKKYTAILTIICGLMLASVVAASISLRREMPNAPSVFPAAIGQTASQASEGSVAESTPAKGPEEELFGPALTLEEIRRVAFSDVLSETGWVDYVSYVCYRGLMQGTEGHFDPEAFVTCGEVTFALRRMSGEKIPAYNSAPFIESAETAAETQTITREQLAILLYQFAAPEETGDEIPAAYRDGDLVPEDARCALAWALKNRLFAGMISDPTDTLYPSLPVSRGQLAQTLVALAACCEKEPLAQMLTAELGTLRVESASRARHEEIQEKVESIAVKYGAMGVQVAVVEKGEVTDAFAYGWAVKDTIPMTTEHKIRSASITKVAVAMAAMILWEEGVVDLDKGVGTYWGVTARNPSHPDEPVSIRAILSHTSSLKTFGWETSRARDEVYGRLQSGDSYMKAKPGSSEAWGYNNYAFGVLGQTLELASGKYLDEVMEDRLWSVMGIDSAFESGSVRETDLLATLYEGEKVYTSHKTLLKNVRPSSLGATGDNYSGGMTISAPELAKMAALLVNDGRYEGLRLLSEESVAMLESDSGVRISDGSHQAYPLRFREGLYSRDRLYYHTGSGYGVYNLLSYDPDARDAVVILTTGASGGRDNQNIYAVCGEITEYIYGVIQ